MENRLTVGRKVLILEIGVRNPVLQPIYWGSMYQGGELHLQCDCGGFDSHLFHQYKLIFHPKGKYTGDAGP